MFKTPNPKPDFNKLEQETLAWWKQNDILNKSIQQRPLESSKTFYDGPITANGEPHYGHMLTFAMKDLIPRYWSMKGFRVDRSLGWDCQGIPVEYEVEKQLGFKEKKDIEKFGVAKFNELCRQSVLKFRTAIIQLEERMGRLTNSDEEFATMDADYIESVWWSLKELYDKGKLYEGFKVVPYSTRAGTSLSNAEVALGGYAKIVDPAVTVKFPLQNEPDTQLLAWTTTPWTMPGNLGLAVGAKIKYVKVKVEGDEATYIVAKDCLENVFGDKAYQIVAEVSAQELIGQEYLPPFDYYQGRENAHKIYAGGHVTTDTGTGVVHLAPYGAEDNEIFAEVGIKSFDYLDDQGDFTSEIPAYAGVNYRKANPQIIADLEAKHLLFSHADYEHDMPMCWRTNTPLIYKPITSWYIAVSKMRSELVANNNQINWVPAHMREGRFGNWLAEIKDWGISRLRYWGTPLPIWKSPTGKLVMIGSFAQLEELSGQKLSDPHRPFVDEITFEKDGETYTRIPDVIDVWYDSGAMPFARFHYPFENKEKFERKFPADFISESVDQTRGWFYSLHAVATTMFNQPAFKNVIVSGFTLDDKGAKLSKSKKNYEPYQVLLEQFGADAMRLVFYNSPISAGEDSAVSASVAKLQVQEYLLPLWNCYSFFITYANIHGWKPDQAADGSTNYLDKWVLAKLDQLTATVTAYLDDYNVPKATAQLMGFLADLSKWYIRRSRGRFAEGDKDALQTLHTALVGLAKLAAPFTPFISEHLYQELVASQDKTALESIHLCDYPAVDGEQLKQSTELLQQMELVRQVCDLGQTLRANSQIKVRQPLATVAVESEQQLTEWMQELISAELNVLQVQKLEVADQPGWIKATQGELGVALNTEITPQLAQAGMLRELTRAIQALRKQLNLQMGEPVAVYYSTQSAELEQLITENKQQIMDTVSASKLEVSTETDTEVEINEHKLLLKLQK